jgi:hypothetical protein
MPRPAAIRYISTEDLMRRRDRSAADLEARAELERRRAVYVGETAEGLSEFVFTD